MPQRNMTPEDFDCLKMTTREAAEYLGLAEATVRKGRSTGKLGGIEDPDYVKIGGKVFYFKKDLQDWMCRFN